MQQTVNADDWVVHPASSRRRLHWQALAVASVVLALAFALQVDSAGQRIALAGLPEFPLPHTCMSRILFGYSCPGCGLTRSFVYLAHGDWESSLTMHRLGWLLFLVAVLQIPYRIAALANPKWEIAGSTVPTFFWIAIAVLLMVNWLASFVPLHR